MSMAVNRPDQSYSHVGQFAHDRGILGYKLDFADPIWDEEVGDWYHRVVVQMHISFPPDRPQGVKHNMTQWRADRLTSMQKALRLGHPRSGIIAVWMDSLMTPYHFWRPGMKFDSRQDLTETKLELWLAGGNLNGQA